jgi:integrase
MNQRYKGVSEGIRKDNFTGNYCAYKKVDSKTVSKTFKSLAAAKNWRMTFVPATKKISEKNLTLNDLWNLYQEQHIQNLATSTKAVRIDRWMFFNELSSIQVYDITPDVLNRFFQNKLAEAKANSSSKRLSFREEIKDLRAMLNWFKDFHDHTFSNPVTKRLFASSRIQKAKSIRDKMTAFEYLEFYSHLDTFFKDVANVQVRVAGRICEVAGLKFSNIDFDKKTVLIKDIVVYGRRKEIIEIKSNPKTGEARVCSLTPKLEEILLRRLSFKHPDSDFVFHVEGKPLEYRRIQYAYEKGLRSANLYGKFSGTHFLRHFTASLTRDVCQNIDSVQAVLGHKSVRQSEHYSGKSAGLQASAMLLVEARLDEISMSGCAVDVQTCSERQ